MKEKPAKFHRAPLGLAASLRCIGVMGGSTIWRPQFGLVDKVRAELGLATKARDVVSDADVEDEEAPRIAQNDDDGAKKRKWSASMDGDDADVDEEEDDTVTDDDDDGDDVDARWTRWTPEEDDVVVDMRSRGETYAAIARELSGRTAAAVQGRWRKSLENRQPDRNGAAWIPEEDAVIVSMKSRLDTYDAIAKELGRTKQAVQNRWFKLKSLQPKRTGAAWTPEDDEFIVDAMARGDTYAAIARELGRTTQALQARWYKLKSLPRDSEGDSIADPSDSKEEDDENEEEEEEEEEDEDEDGSDKDADPSPTPHHVPEINQSSTRIPGLKGINLVTTNGKFWMNWQHRNENVSKTVDTLDEAVETYNMVCLKHETHTITEQHRAVAEEMQRKRELMVAGKAKWMMSDDCEVEEDDTPCLVCGNTNGEADFLLCDSCPKGGHYRCLGLPGVPDGDWHCEACAKERLSRIVRQERNDLPGKGEDGLGEADSEDEDGSEEDDADASPSPSTAVAPELNKNTTTIPGLQGIKLVTATGRFKMHWQHRGENVIATVDTLGEAVSAYNTVCSKHGWPTHTVTAQHRAVVEEMQRKRVAAQRRLLQAEAAVTDHREMQRKRELMVTGKASTPSPTPHHVPEINESTTGIPGLKGIKLLTLNGRFKIYLHCGGKYVGTTVDTLDMAVEAYNKLCFEHGRADTLTVTAQHRAVVEEMQRKRELMVAGKAKASTTSPTPHHVPEINEQTTGIPGLKGIRLATVSGRFRVHFQRGGKYASTTVDTLDEATEAYIKLCFEHGWVHTQTITAQHRVVVEAMQRKRALMVAENASKRELMVAENASKRELMVAEKAKARESPVAPVTIRQEPDAIEISDDDDDENENEVDVRLTLSVIEGDPGHVSVSLARASDEAIAVRALAAVEPPLRHSATPPADRGVKRKAGWTSDEDECIVRMKGRGETEKTIAKELPGRSEDEVAQRWATRSDRWVTVDDPGVIVIDDSPAEEVEPEPEPEPEPEAEPEPEPEAEPEPEVEPEVEAEVEAEQEPDRESVDLSGDGGNNDPEVASPLRDLAERVRDETGLTLADGWKVVTDLGHRKRFITPGGKRFGSMSEAVTFLRKQLEDPDVKTIDGVLRAETYESPGTVAADAKADAEAKRRTADEKERAAKDAARVAEELADRAREAKRKLEEVLREAEPEPEPEPEQEPELEPEPEVEPEAEPELEAEPEVEPELEPALELELERGTLHELREREAWVQCESCDKWRRVPHSQAARFSRKDAGNWICSISSHPKINSCDVPQELGNDDIDARIAMGVECPFYDDDDLNPPAFIVHRDSPVPAKSTPAEATPATPAGALWTPEEDALLLGMRERGDTFTAISRALPGRSNSACSNRWGLLTRDPNEVRVKVPRQPRVLADPTEIEEQALEAMYAALRARFPGVELDGWRVEVTERKMGTSQGQLDKYYLAPPLPEGDSAGMSSPSMRFRSMTEVVNYVEARYVEGDDVEGKKVQPPDVAAKTPASPPPEKDHAQTWNEGLQRFETLKETLFPRGR